MAIELIFRGELLPGASRAEAVAGLARRFNQSSETVEQRLFSGRPVRVKTVDNQADAEKWVKAFADLGARLEIRPRATATALTEPVKSAGTPPETTPSPRATQRKSPARTPALPADASGSRRGRTFTMAALAMTGVAVLAVASAWYTQPVWSAGDTSDAQRAVSRALAARDLVALGHVDVARAAQLQSRLLGEPDPDALLSPDDDMISSLARAGIDPRRQIDDALVALYSDGETATYAAVLLGTFDGDAVRDWLDSRYQVERFDPGTSTVYFSWLNEQTCQPAPLHAARISQDLLLITAADRMDGLWQRVETNSPSETEIGAWLTRTEHQILTLGVFAPASLGNAAGGSAGMILAGAGQAAERAEALYFGATPSLLPPGVVLGASVESRDQDFISTTREAADKWLDDARADAEQGLPELVDLYDRLTFSSSAERVQATMQLDTNFDDELQKLITSVFNQIFQISPGPANRNQAVSERLEDHPRTFADASADQLAPYAGFGDGFFTPQWQGGPFALAVSSLALEDDAVLLTLRGEGRGLPNLGARSELVRLKITDVVDHQGTSLLPAQPCGPARVRGWTDFGAVSEGVRFQDGESIRYPTVSVQKELKLRPGTRARDVAAIRGEIEYRMPTRVTRSTVQQPLAGKVVELSNVRVRFRQSSPSSLDYQTSGETHRVVAVRGLNGDGRVLASGSSMWSDDWFGGGKSASVSLRGTIAEAEVVLAEAVEPLRYSFELPGAFPPVAARDRLFHEPAPPATPESLAAALHQPPPAVTFSYREPTQTTPAGPALLALQSLQASSFMGLVAQLELYVSDDLPLLGQLNGASLFIDRALSNGTAVELDLAAPVTFSRDGGYWVNGEYQPDAERPWLKGQASLQAPDYEAGEPTAVEGRLLLRASTDPRSVNLSVEPGERWQDNGVSLVVREWHENAVVLDIPEGAERVVSVTAFAGEERVGHAATLDTSGQTPRARVKLYQRPELLRVTVAADTVEHEQPFRMLLGE